MILNGAKGEAYGHGLLGIVNLREMMGRSVTRVMVTVVFLANVPVIYVEVNRTMELSVQQTLAAIVDGVMQLSRWVA